MDMLSNNLYLYISNNPITNLAPSGGGWFTAILTVVAVAKAVITIASNLYLTATKNDFSNDMFNQSMYNADTKVSQKM